MWRVPSTYSVSSGLGRGSACPHLPQGGLTDLAALGGGSGTEGGGRAAAPVLLLVPEPGTDIGHVDFLAKVHGLVERPYVIAGLHFDQVSAPRSWSWGPWRRAWEPWGARPWLLTEAETS